MNIRVDWNYPIQDGTEVVFRSPVDCSQVTGLIVYYDGGSQEFAFADAHGNNVGDIDHLFAENVAVKVILDVTTGMAFVQNADTNAYLEGRFASLSSIHYCAFTGKLNQNGAIGHIDGANTNAFAKGLPKANDLFVTTSGYVGRVTQVIAGTTITGEPAHTIAYALVADLRAQPPVKGVDYWTEADKAEIVRETETAMIGDMDAALDELHAYAQALVGGVGE